jgi:predicted O-methyltransferase YrrM
MRPEWQQMEGRRRDKMEHSPMSRVHTPITDEMAAYVRAVGVREPEPLRRQREGSDAHPQAGMQSAPEQGQMLHFLARAIGARNTLEVGVFLGYSSTWVALALPPEGRIVACDGSEEYTATARRTWADAGVADKVDLRIAPALETLDALLAGGRAGSFDFAFIDADKANYWNYYERCLRLLRAGGVIAVDNVLWHGQVVDPYDTSRDTEAIREFNRRVQADTRVAFTMATIGDGLTLACKL